MGWNGLYLRARNQGGGLGCHAGNYAPNQMRNGGRHALCYGPRGVQFFHQRAKVRCQLLQALSVSGRCRNKPAIRNKWLPNYWKGSRSNAARAGIRFGESQGNLLCLQDGGNWCKAESTIDRSEAKITDVKPNDVILAEIAVTPKHVSRGLQELKNGTVAVVSRSNLEASKKLIPWTGLV